MKVLFLFAIITAVLGTKFIVSNQLNQIKKIEKELELYDSKLFKTDRWIVLNKNDIDYEKSKKLKKSIESHFPKIKIYNISSISKNGIKELVNDISEWCLKK